MQHARTAAHKGLGLRTITEFESQTNKTLRRAQLNKATAVLGLERTEEAKAQLQETAAAFKLTLGEQKDFILIWQLLAAAPTPPAGIAEFMALAKKLFGQTE